MHSLRFRLSLALLISLILAFIVLWLAVSQGSRFLAEEYMATRLEHDSESLLAALKPDAQGKPTIDATRIDAIYMRPFSGHYYKIIGQHGTLRSRSLWDQDMVVQTIPAGIQQRLYQQGPQQQPLLIFVKTYNKFDQSFTIAVAEDLSTLEQRLARLQFRFGLIMVAFLLILVGLQAWILHNGLRPLDRTRNELRSLAQGELAQLDHNVPREIAPLVDEINHLLKILEQRLSRSRNALGDLTHALKKPLTVLQQLVEDETLKGNPELYQSFRQQLEQIQRHVTRILKRARLAGEGPVGSYFHTDTDIPPLIETLKKIYHEKALNIVCNVPPGMIIRADREDILELMGNLLDNACKWSNHTVRLRLQAEDPVEINVEDDGPGVDAGKHDSLTTRGLRLDEKTAGHGLGLSIVNDIVTNLGGELILQTSADLGGLHAKVILHR